jgi:DNA processing protein
MDEKQKYLIALSRIPRFGIKKFRHLRQYFPSAEEIWSVSFSGLKEMGWDDKKAEEFIFHRDQIDPEAEQEKVIKEDITVIDTESEHYPKLLNQIYFPPFLLYCRGNIAAASDFSLAVVGSRKPTNYGQMAAEKLCADICSRGLTIVSGLAVGIDSIAHFTAVENNAATVAVLGSGLDKDNIYPPQNRSLAEKIIAKNGAVISEFPLGTMPVKHNFPMRNRLISGLSLGTLVIEAGESSGALITADFSLEQNREVFAVPGSIFSDNSVGTNRLIKKGAKLIASVEDILEELNLSDIKRYQSTQEVIPGSPEEASILSNLTEPRHINELVRLTALSMPELNATLVLLEMKGLVKNLGNMTFARRG